MVCRRIFITGQVQGVGFRYHTHGVAAKLKLQGYVRNLDDGRVEIFVSGSTKDVEHLLSWVRKGPPSAKVDQVEVLEIDEGFPTETFHIRRDGGKP